MQKPRKRDFLQRAHANPFSDQNVFYPHSPKDMDWSQYYSNSLPPTILDLGCGYGRYMAYLGAKYTEDNIVGLEIRKKVAEYALQKVQEFNNATVICTNGMLFMVNFFDKHSLSKIFILFPDPHFKKRKQKARIVCKQMLDVYEYVLSDDGEIYIATDVEDLFRDMCDCFNAHEMFVLCKGDDETSLITETDEARRAGIKSGQVFTACYRKMICQDLPSANK